MTLSQGLVVVSIIVGVMAILRGVRNASKAWDSIVNSVDRLNEKMGELIVLKEKEHRAMEKRIGRLEDRKGGNGNAV